MTFASNITPLRPVSRGPVPVLIPDNQDDVLSRRWDAALMAEHIIHETQHPYHLARLQGDFERRLDVIATQRAQA